MLKHGSGMWTGCDQSRCDQMWWNDALKMRNAVPQLCCVKCGVMVRCGGVMHNVANIWRDLKCGVEYMECGVMWNVM